MAKTFVKKGLITGVGSLYLQSMKTEDSTSGAPVYDEDVYETPTIDKVSATLEMSSKKIYLSNLMHSDITAVKSATITLDAGYLPEGFAEEHSGMIKLDEGSYAMPTTPIKKPFRMAFPSIDEFGDEIILNYPKCTIAPVDISNETEREETAEKLQQFVITAIPMYYKGDLEKANVYYRQSLDTETTKAKYDRNKLLEQGWFDKATLKKCELTQGA